MEELHWNDEQQQLAKAAVMERFALNSVARQFIAEATFSATATTVPRSRFHFEHQMVVDGETLRLHEPYATVRLTRGKVTKPICNAP